MIILFCWLENCITIKKFYLLCNRNFFHFNLNMFCCLCHNVTKESDFRIADNLSNQITFDLVISI